MSITEWMLNPTGLTAHGFCLSWAPGLIALHTVSDVIIGIAYYSIPIALAWFVHKRRDVQYGWMIYAFVAFILACGTTHFISILTLWVPAYGIEGMVKLVTAALSIATAVALWPLVSRLVALPSPSQLAELNAGLSRTVAERDRTVALLRDSEARVRATNVELERRVAERTADLASAVEHLTTALNQRDLLLREVYHRVKNNLQIVDGLLTLQAHELTDPDAARALLNLRGRIWALGLVHQQLMRSADLKTFDIAPFLEELVKHIQDSGGKSGVTLSVETCPLDVGLDYAVPLAMVVNELVSNWLKHAFPDGTGNVSVVLKPDGDGKVLLVVADDGNGQPDSDTSGRSEPSLGLSLVEGFVAQLEGTMSVRRGNGTKTEIRVAAPVNA
jgi:two-component sensor histidine kinase